MAETLYKYISLKNFKRFVDIIMNKRLYAAKYTELNDPMEGIYYHTPNFRRVLRDKIYEGKQNLRICSLSKEKDNLLMWSHYADGHKGIIIGVQIEEPDKYEKNDIIYSGLKKIEEGKLNKKTAVEILSRKLISWKYEKEVRVFVKQDQPSLKPFINVYFVSITFGCRIKKEDETFIRELVELKYNNIEFINSSIELFDIRQE